MATHMITWLRSTSHGVVTASSITSTARMPPRGDRQLFPERRPRPRRRPGHGFRSGTLPLFGEAKVKMAEAKRMKAMTNASPGSSFGPVDPADMDIAPAAAPMGNQYINSIEKLITACIKA